MCRSAWKKGWKKNERKVRHRSTGQETKRIQPNSYLLCLQGRKGVPNGIRIGDVIRMKGRILWVNSSRNGHAWRKDYLAEWSAVEWLRFHWSGRWFHWLSQLFPPSQSTKDPVVLRALRFSLSTHRFHSLVLPPCSQSQVTSFVKWSYFISSFRARTTHNGLEGTGMDEAGRVVGQMAMEQQLRRQERDELEKIVPQL